jgi:hypothetical protein
MSRRVSRPLLLLLLASVAASLARAPVAAQADPEPARGPVGDGAPITPAFAEALYARVAPLAEADGCRIVRFDTSRFRIDVGVQAPSGAVTVLGVAATRAASRGARGVGEWMVAAPDEFGQQCGATLAAIERALLATAPPPPTRFDLEPTPVTPAYVLILVCVALLVPGTAYIVGREWRAARPAPLPVALLLAVWAAGLALRLLLSPHTFLHEFYHVAEWISWNLTERIPATYGYTGPVLYRTVAALLGRPTDVDVIFVTNAVLASLAIPAVALLDLVLVGSWARALTAAVLLAVLPLQLRFAAAEDLFIVAVTFCLWATALFALYLRTRRVADVLCTALALALAMQTRPEIMTFPAVLIALVAITAPRQWRVLIAAPTLAALALLGGLLVPRLLEIHAVLLSATALPTEMRAPPQLFSLLQLGDLQWTPPLYWLLLLAGLAWGVRYTPALMGWVAVVFFGYAYFIMSLFHNPPSRLRPQLLPMAFTVLVAAGSAPAWLAFWRRRPRLGQLSGGLALIVGAMLIVRSSRGVVTELGDQQLEWAFLQRTVPELPERATLLTAARVGGRNLGAFPGVLLVQTEKSYAVLDVRQAASGEIAWPQADGELLFYQGMYCYFAFDDEPPPDPMTAACRAVHERYVAEPLVVETLNAPSYPQLHYAQPPFRIGFFRLRARG